MKYLKIAVLFSLINAIFFGAFLAVLYQRNLKLQSFESFPSSTQNESVQSALATGLPSRTPTVTPEKKPAQPAQQPAPSVNRCIVTIKGQRYDVTDFRNQHSGGDIFVCNTDMTQTFFGKHDQQLLDSPRMAALKVQ